MKENSPKKKKGSFSGALVLFIIMIAASLLQEMPRRRFDPELVFVLVGTVAVIVVAVIFVKIAAKKVFQSDPGARPAQPFRAAGTQSAQPVRSVPAAAQPSRSYRGAHIDKNGPDAYCLVCDQTGVDHFERDRLRRLRQLDYFLSIGIIERQEYNLLRAKYSREVPHQKVL